MAVPTNKENQAGCTPVSSNCVIWQGPDIPCIKLCKGDSISDVTAKLAEELCVVLDYLDVDSYDLECFNPVCPTLENFHDLIQFIITQLCNLQTCCENVVTVEESERSAAKTLTTESVVTIAPCFQFRNRQGDLVTTMTITEYAQAIGSVVCSLITDITNLTTRVTSLEERVTEIENTCCDDTPPPAPLISSCLLGPNPGGWNYLAVLQNLETAFCNLQAATGLPESIYIAIARQCAGLDAQESLASPGTNMASIPGWVSSADYVNSASALNNIWLTICDLRAAVRSLADCCQPGCNDIQLNLSASISAGNLLISLTGVLPTGFVDCTPTGSFVTIQDSDGNYYATNISIPVNINQPPVSITLASTPLNPLLDFVITMYSCLENPTEGLTCERVLVFNLVNNVICPAMTINPAGATISYSFTNIYAPPITYTVELWNSTSTVLVDSIVHVDPALGVVSSTFTGLSVSTTYTIRTVITYNGNTKNCPFTSVTTDPTECLAATLFNVIPAF